MYVCVCVWLSHCAVHLRLTMNDILNQLCSINKRKELVLCWWLLGSWQYVPLPLGQDLADVSLGRMTLLWVVNLESSSKGPPHGSKKWTSLKRHLHLSGSWFTWWEPVGFSRDSENCALTLQPAVWPSGKPHSLLSCRLGAGWAVTTSCHFRKRTQLPSKGVESPGSHGAEEKGWAACASQPSSCSSDAFIHPGVAASELCNFLWDRHDPGRFPPASVCVCVTVWKRSYRKRKSPSSVIHDNCPASCSAIICHPRAGPSPGGRQGNGRPGSRQSPSCHKTSEPTRWFCHRSVTQLCPTLWNSMDCSTPGFPVLHCLPEFARTHVRWVGDAIQPSCPLLSPSPPAFSLSQHQGLF